MEEDINSLARSMQLEPIHLMSIVEGSYDFEAFFSHMREIYPYLDEMKCEVVWSRYWEIYSQS